MRPSGRKVTPDLGNTFSLLILFFFLLASFGVLAQSSYPPSLPADFHQERRDALRDSMKGLSMAAFFSSPVRPRSKDIDHEYLQDRDLYYFSGVREKNSLLLVFSDTITFDSIRTDELLFLPPIDPEDALWHGSRLGIESAEDSFNIGKALPNSAFSDFPLRPERFDHVHWKNDKRGVIDNENEEGDLASLLDHFERKTDPVKERRGYEQLHNWCSELREVKTAEERALLQKAIDNTSYAHKALMRALKPGMWEYQAEGLVEQLFRASACSGPGFPSIVGSGPNSCVLHYNRNGDRMDASEVVVVDIGGEYGGYSADITRTLPVNGRFSKEQKSIYELVLKAQKAAIEACRPGERFWDPHQKAQNIIARGLSDLGVIESDGEVTDHFMHGTSHYLGLDVHDAGTNGDLRPGTVLTVEPGVYIPKGSDCEERWWNIGVRIEDDILVTKSGPKNLSKGIPRAPEKVEDLMQERSLFPTFEEIKSEKEKDP